MEKLETETKYWLALGKNPRLGPASFSEILSTNVPFESLFNAKRGELLSYGLSQKVVDEILYCQTNNEPDKVWDELAKREIKFVTILDDEYPTLLKETYNPPAILYYKGVLENASTKLGIVGSRRPTDYGASVTEYISTNLSRAGINIVSGMAIGIDTIAHQSALKAGGLTIAVLGCGLDQVYPSRNVGLAKDIVENGAVVSMFPLGVHPYKSNFVIRNRIISGLSAGVLITEAAKASGSLITAAAALEQNRDVFAVPGPIYNLNSKGPNNLIKIGARLVTCAEDILEELGLVQEKGEEKVRREAPKAETPEEGNIIKLLEIEPKNIDMIIKESGLDQRKVAETLTMMEITDKVKHIGGSVYRLNY